MAWNDDDRTDPGLSIPPTAPRQQAAQQAPGQWPAQPAPTYPTQSGYPPQQQYSTGGFPVQQQQPTPSGGYAVGYPPQPNPTGGYPAQPNPTGGYPVQPNPTGGYPAQPNPTGGYPAQPNPTGGYPAQPNPTGGYNTGGYPASGYQGTPQYGVPVQPHPTGGFQAPQPGFTTGGVPVLEAPKIAVEEDAKASRVVFGISGMAFGGIFGTLLGIINAKLEGIPIVEGTDLILNFGIWSAFAVGLLAYVFPDRFAYGLQRLMPQNDEE